MKNLFSIVEYFDRRLLIRSGILLGSIMLFTIFCVYPFSTLRARLKAKVNKQENSIKRSMKKINDYPQLVKQREVQKELLASYIERLVSEGAETYLLGEISDIAKKSDVKIISVKPQPIAAVYDEDFSNYFKPYGYELILESGYHEFGIFLNKLEQYTIMLQLSGVTIEPNENNERIHNIVCTILTYVKL